MVLASAVPCWAGETNLLAEPDQLVFEKQYGGLEPEHSLEDHALTLKWQPNPRQAAPVSSGGFAYKFNDPASLAGAALKWSAQGTATGGEPLVALSVSAFDEAGARCEIHTKSAPGSGGSPDDLRVVFGEAGDAKKGWRYEKGTGDLGRVQRIVFTFAAPAAQGGDVVVSEVRLALP